MVFVVSSQFLMGATWSSRPIPAPFISQARSANLSSDFMDITALRESDLGAKIHAFSSMHFIMLERNQR